MGILQLSPGLLREVVFVGLEVLVRETIETKGLRAAGAVKQLPTHLTGRGTIQRIKEAKNGEKEMTKTHMS